MTPDPRSRHTLESAIELGTYSSLAVPIDDDQTHHISGTISLEISGATPVDRPYTHRLQQAIEQAVIETIENFDGSAPAADPEKHAGDGIEAPYTGGA